MQEIARYTTIDERNSKAWGEEIADILVLIGNSIDTFFKDTFNCSYIKNHLSATGRDQRDRKSLRIDDYYDILEPYYEFSRNEVTAGFGLGNVQILNPFKNFNNIRINDADRSYVPVWWDAYNDTKHQFYEKMENANLGNAVTALAGLLLLNSLHICSKIYIARRGFINWASYANLREGLEGELRKTRIGTTRWASPNQVITSLFVFTLRVDVTLQHPHDVNI
jgi:hypothetical protein